MKILYNNFSKAVRFLPALDKREDIEELLIGEVKKLVELAYSRGAEHGDVTLVTRSKKDDDDDGDWR